MSIADPHNPRAFMRQPSVALALGALLAAAPLAAQAPAAAAPARQQVISFQPINAVFTVYAAEYERAVASTLTLGVGATGFFPDDVSYTAGDLKLRYYPQARPLQGFSFGGTVGITRVSEDVFDEVTGEGERSATGPSAGVMLDYGWLLGASQRFYVGLGIGAKVVFVDDDDFSDDFIARYPTARISVGHAF
jgi:hypothetical protein